MHGLGTLINAVAIVLGAALGRLAGDRLSERTRSTITDALGLIVLVVGALNIVSLSDHAYVKAVSSHGTLLVVLGAVVLGAILGSALRIEDQVGRLGEWAHRRLSRDDSNEERERFIEGFVSGSLLFCIGPLAILGALSDGLGHGIDQLVLKSALDFFAATAFAASLGWGVALAAVPVALYQGTITVAGVALGSFLPGAEVAALTATGGVLLLGIGLRLLQIRHVRVADLLPALVFAPAITALVATLRG